MKALKVESDFVGSNQGIEDGDENKSHKNELDKPVQKDSGVREHGQTKKLLEGTDRNLVVGRVPNDQIKNGSGVYKQNGNEYTKKKESFFF